MPFTPETIIAKPNNQCIKCDKLGVICDGPNAASMSNERFCEWCKLRKNELGWSNQKLADVTGLSKTTIDRIMTGKITGLNAETINVLSCALVYGYNSYGESWGKFPCPLSANAPDDDVKILREENARLLLQLKQLSENDRGKIDHLKNQINFDEQQIREKDKLLKERYQFLKRKDFVISILSILLSLSVAVIIVALAMGAANPNEEITQRVLNNSVTSADYIGNIHSKVFHRPDCAYLPDRNNQQIFYTRKAATNAGYSPCSHCNPLGQDASSNNSNYQSDFFQNGEHKKYNVQADGEVVTPAPVRSSTDPTFPNP